jgi:sulfoxide reductase heme-binding subunit YedZ
MVGVIADYSIQVGYDAEKRHRSALLIQPTSPSRTGQREHRSSYWHRRIARHMVIALATVACVSLFWELFFIRLDVISRFSISTAYPALFLTAAAATIGPWNVLRGRTNPVSFDLRRDLGIWAGIMALLHTGVGLNVHLRGRPWLYFIDQHYHVRHDLFGIGNDTGLLAALVFLLLLAISNDLSLRRLGTKRWKSLQRWTYMAVALTLMHAIAYQLVEKRQAAYDALLWATIAMTTVLQIAGWWRTKRKRNKGAMVSPIQQ